MGIGSQWWLIVVLGLLAFPGSGQCLKIWGTVTDLRTLAVVPEARITIRTKEEKVIAQVMNGSYQATLPCQETTLVVEANGYCSLTMPIPPIQSTSDSVRFYVPLLLLPREHQTADQPYFQSEQSHTELEKNSKEENRKTERIFRIADALTGLPVQASVCLYYTQSARKSCFTTTGAKSEQAVAFTEPDIIALEVNANGYQDYQGNLILEKLDGQTRTYTIRLQRRATLLSIANAQTDGLYSLSRGEVLISVQKGEGRTYFQYLEPGSYILKVTDPAGTTSTEETVTVLPGLNLYEGKSRKKAAAAVATLDLKSKEVAAPALLTGHTLYFDQSDYRLRLASRNQLDSLSGWLVQHPHQSVSIEGHTDNVGNAKLNQILSEFRAKVVSTYLSFLWPPTIRKTTGN
jgi:flagellar motor protein MotB